MAAQLGFVTLDSGSCSTLITSAQNSIEKASVMTLSPEARALVERARATLTEAKKDHASGRSKLDYANCTWKARTAQAQAEAAAAISKP
ncbi:MAG TPA: hypothetical protein VMS64_08680 [Candidatus Methylomirabilis sp.]|nr:hypothetical protein [Candidatus Methylomirabilis sp.]